MTIHIVYFKFNSMVAKVTKIKPPSKDEREVEKNILFDNKTHLRPKAALAKPVHGRSQYVKHKLAPANVIIASRVNLFLINKLLSLLSLFYIIYIIIHIFIIYKIYILLEQ